MQQQELEKMQIRNADETARNAIGPRKKKARLDSPHSSGGFLEVVYAVYSNSAFLYVCCSIAPLKSQNDTNKFWEPINNRSTTTDHKATDCQLTLVCWRSVDLVGQ